MRKQKTNEKILRYMESSGFTVEELSDHLGIIPYEFRKKLRENVFSVGDIIALKRLGVL